MYAPFSRVPLLPILIAFIVGIIIAQHEFSIVWAIIPIALAAVIYFRRYIITSLILIALALGFIDGTINYPKPISPSLSQYKAYYQGKIIEINESESSTSAIININAIGSSPKELTKCNEMKCMVIIPSTAMNIQPSDQICFYAILSSPKNQNAPDSFDYATHLHRKGIVATTIVRPDDIINTEYQPTIFSIIENLRFLCSLYLYNSNLSEGSAQFLNTTITGDTSSITDTQRLSYSTAGIAHILALSGLHVGIITLVINLLLFPLFLMQKNKIRILITIILLWFYAIMTGLSPSVTRAVIMATLYFGALIFQRHHSSLNAMCFAALAILIINPLQLFDVGFQLSFVAVTCILIFANRLNPINRRRHNLLHLLVSIFTVSIAAMLGTGIIATYYFHNIPIYFLLGNALSSFLLPPLIGGGVILILLQSIGIPVDWLCPLIDGLYICLDFITTQINALPGATINQVYFPYWIMYPYFLSIVALYLALTKQRIVYIASAVVLFATSVTLSYLQKTNYPDDEFFIPQDTYYTNIIYRHKTSAMLVTTAPEQDKGAMLSLCQRRHRDFLGRRSCSNLQLVSENDTIFNLIRHNNMLTIGNTNLILIESPDDIMHINRHINYAIICRGYKSDISFISNKISVDTILLSYDLHPKRHNRFANECTLSKIPFRSLKESKSFHIIQP